MAHVRRLLQAKFQRELQRKQQPQTVATLDQDARSAAAVNQRQLRILYG